MDNIIITWFLTALLTVFLLNLWRRFGITDVPNYRSSHAEVTPTAAGVCFSLVYLCSVFANYFNIATFTQIHLDFGLGILVLTLIGFIDDWRELNYKSRLISHVIAVGFVLFWQDLTFIEYLVWFFIGVGLINACNFLDGINGLLAGQWLLTTGFLLSAFAEISSIFWILWICVAVYLFFNFPKSRLFMGDTGSTILGFSYFAMIFYLTTPQFPTLLFHKDSFILFALFPLSFAWCDVAFTLIRRLTSKRSMIASFGDYGFHLQAKFFKGHNLVTIVYLSLNCLLAYMAQILFSDRQYIYAVCSSYICLQILHILFINKISKKYHN